MALALREVVNKSAAYLRAAGLASPRLEAELLAGKVLALDRTQLYVQYDRPVAEAELAALHELLAARVRTGRPLAYLIGHKAFFGLVLSVDDGVFIPRPETEELVEAAATALGQAGRDTQFELLDLCTGTGAIGLALASVLPAARVTAVDLDRAAVLNAEANARRLGLAGRFQAHCGDLWEGVPGGLRFDGIFANPPYVPRGDLASLPLEIKGHEPLAALDGGEDGLLLLRRIVTGAPERLKPGGVLGVEVGSRAQGDEVIALVLEAGLTRAEFLPDLAGNMGFVMGRMGGLA
ncbi:MAG: peptide chain release factor N(5)-glutamine methyltransferase [Patescibacteria group bacterium]